MSSALQAAYGNSFLRTKIGRRPNTLIIRDEGGLDPFSTLFKDVRSTPIFFENASWPPALLTSSRNKETTSLDSNIFIQSPFAFLRNRQRQPHVYIAARRAKIFYKPSQQSKAMVGDSAGPHQQARFIGSHANIKYSVTPELK